MTPFYIVVRMSNTDLPLVTTVNLASQKKALEIASNQTKSEGVPHYVMECIAKVELPVPQPIVTMKGD